MRLNSSTSCEIEVIGNAIKKISLYSYKDIKKHYKNIHKILLYIPFINLYMKTRYDSYYVKF
jgi:hypothetical protein